MVTKKPGAALAAKEKAKKKTAVDVAANKKALKNSKRKPTAVIKRAVLAAARMRVLKREAATAINRAIIVR